MLLPPSFTPLGYVPDPIPAGGFWFVFESGRLLTAAATLPAHAHTVPIGDRPPVPVDGARFIGLLSAAPCWAAQTSSRVAPAGFTFEPLRGLFDRLPDELVAVAGRAAQALEFDRTHRHCGVCAARTEEATRDELGAAPNAARCTTRVSPRR